MESAQLLDILGNANRRKILQLLASRPYYVSEISERIALGPKAVLQHLDMLEQNGLIQVIASEQRRKYYHITDNFKLEVFVSPYSYTMETTAIAQHPSSEQVHTSAGGTEDNSESVDILKQLNRHFLELESKRRLLANKQHEIEGEMTDVMAACIDRVYEVARDSIEAEIMLALVKEPQDKRSLSMALTMPEYFMEEYILSLLERGIIIERKQDNRQLLSLV